MQQNDNGWTALHTAAYHGKASAVLTLLEHERRASKQAKISGTGDTCESSVGDATGCKQCGLTGLAGKVTQQGSTAVHLAVAARNLAIVQVCGFASSQLEAECSICDTVGRCVNAQARTNVQARARGQ